MNQIVKGKKFFQIPENTKRVFPSSLQVLLHCVRMELAGKQRNEICLPDDREIDWKQVLGLALNHGLHPLLYRFLNTRRPEMMPDGVMRRLRNFYKMNMVKALLLMAELRRVIETLENHSIPVLPYKGVSLGERLYGDASLRVAGDIDIIVPWGQLFPASDTVEELGYRPLHDLSDRQESIHARENYHWILRHTHKPVTLEIHHDIVSRVFSAPLNWKDIWRRQRWISLRNLGKIRVMSPEDCLLVLLVHGAKHRWESLKWLVDIVLLIRRAPTLDWETVMERSKAWRVNRIALLGLFLSRTLLDADVPEDIWQSARDNPAVQELAGEIISGLPGSGDTPSSEYEQAIFFVRQRESRWDRLRITWRMMTTASWMDVSANANTGKGSSRFLNRAVRVVRREGMKTMMKTVFRLFAAFFD